MKRLILFTCCLSSILGSYAQNPPKRIFIVDTVPDLVLNNIINYNTQTAKLSDFKGKAIILDFWNKGCSSCIAGFPKLEALQKKFKDDLIILLVNDQMNETRKNLSSLFNKSPILKSVTLPMIFGDSIFSNKSELFPHYGVPYHVWIDKNGIVKATTSGSYATSGNIKDLIEGKMPNVAVKEALLPSDLDTSSINKSVLEMHNGMFKKYLVYYNKIKDTSGHSDDLSIYSIKKEIIDPAYPYHTLIMKNPTSEIGNLAALSLAGSVKDKEGKKIGFRYRNKLLGLYAMAYDINQESTKILVETENAKRYYEPKITDSSGLIWQRNNSFLYETVLPGKYDWFNKEVKLVMKKDLENYFGLTGHVDLRQTKCLVFYRTAQSLSILTKGGVFIGEDTQSDKGLIIKNGSFKIYVINKLARMLRIDQGIDAPLVLDETGINKRVDLVIKSKFNDIGALNLELMNYGIAIREEVRLLPALILTKVK